MKRLCQILILICSFSFAVSANNGPQIVKTNVKEKTSFVDNKKRVERAVIKESSITKIAEETNSIGDGHKCENKEVQFKSSIFFMMWNVINLPMTMGLKYYVSK